MRRMNFEKIHNILLYCFVLLLHFENWDALGTGEALSVTTAIAYLYLLFAFRDVRRFFAMSYLKVYLIPVLLFFCLLTIMSYLNYDSLYREYIHIFDFSIFQCIILFVILANHLRGNSQTAYRALLAFVAGGVITGILFYFGIGTTMVEGRLSIFGDDQNVMGVRLAIAIMVLLSLVFENPLKWSVLRFLMLLALLFLLPVLALTGSRTGIITLSVGLFVFILFIKMQRWFKLSFMAVAVAGIVLIGSYFSKYDLLQQRFTNSIENGENAGRTNIWQHVLPIFYSSPIVGVGTTGYGKRVLSIFGLFQKGHYRGTHNVYLEILCYTGILGLLLFLLFMIRLLIKSFQLYRHNNYLVTGIILLIIIIAMFVLHGLYNKTYWFFYAFVAALPIMGSSEPEKNNG